MIKVLFNALLRSLKYVFILGWFFLSNIKLLTHMDVSENNGFSPQIIHLSIINSIHFGVFPYFWFNTHLKHGKAVRLPSREFYETNGSPTGGTPQPAACVTAGPKRRKKPLSGWFFGANFWVFVNSQHPFLGGGNSNMFFMFNPKIGEDSHFHGHIFQMGWFNHQLVKWFQTWFLDFLNHFLEMILEGSRILLGLE